MGYFGLINLKTTISYFRKYILTKIGKAWKEYSGGGCVFVEKGKSMYCIFSPSKFS